MPGNKGMEQIIDLADNPANSGKYAKVEMQDYPLRDLEGTIV